MPRHSSAKCDILPALWDEAGFDARAESDATGSDLVGTIERSMTAISAPTSMHPAPDESVVEIAERLSESFPERAWGPVASFFLSIFTVGLLPLLVWPRRWNAFADFEKRQMISLALFWRKRASPMQVQSLDAAISQMGPQSFFNIVPILIVGFFGLLVFSLLNQGRSLESILRLTLVYHRYHWWISDPLEANLHLIWTISLLVGYVCHWVAVRSHASAVESLAMKVNEIAGAKRIRSMAIVRSGLNPIWVLAAIGLCFMQCWWGIPLMLAGALQRQYMNSTSPRIRQALVKQLLDRPMGRMGFCSTAGCGAPRREGAKFCPRCGARV